MKNPILIVCLLWGLSLSMFASVGDVFTYNGVQYKVTSLQDVSAVHYDSAFIIIPDSVSDGTQKYAVTDAISQYSSANCALRHYRKIDFSKATNITTLKDQSSELIAIDTLILPPDLKNFPAYFVTKDSITKKAIEDSDHLLPGIHRVYSTGTQEYWPSISKSPSLVEADFSTYTGTFTASNGAIGGAGFHHDPFLQKLRMPNTTRAFGLKMFSRDYHLTDISMPDSLKIIDASICDEVPVTLLPIGAGVEEIHSQFAQEWYQLQWIDVDSANAHFMSKDGILYTKDQSTLWHFPYYWPDEEFRITPETRTIGAYAFAYTAEEKTMSSNQFVLRMQEAHLKKIICTPTLQELQPYAFFGSSIKEYVRFYDSQIKTIPYSCFHRSSIESIYLPETLLSIDVRAFAETYNLQHINGALSQRLNYIGKEAFRHAWSLEELDLFGCSELYDIPQHMCWGDTSLTYVALPRNVKTIADNAFRECTALEEFLCPAIEPIPINASVFEGVNKQKCRLLVPARSVDAYKKANVWKDFFNIEGVPLYYLAIDVTDTLAGWVIGEGLYQKGEKVSVIAIPYDGYEFVTWSDGVTNNPRLVYVTQDISLVAEFAKSTTPEPSTEAVESITTPNTPDKRKLLHNGQLLIQNDNRLYNAQGKEVK